jgi:ankyrin repeat protein
LGELIGQRNGPAVAKIAEQHPRVLFEANAYGVVPLMTAAFHGDLPACQAMVQVTTPTQYIITSTPQHCG